MTRIINGYAQPDIVAEKDNEKIVIFVETPKTLHNKEHMGAVATSWRWLQKHEPNARIDLVYTVPKRRHYG